MIYSVTVGSAFLKISLVLQRQMWCIDYIEIRQFLFPNGSNVNLSQFSTPDQDFKSTGVIIPHKINSCVQCELDRFTILRPRFSHEESSSLVPRLRQTKANTS